MTSQFPALQIDTNRPTTNTLTSSWKPRVGVLFESFMLYIVTLADAMPFRIVAFGLRKCYRRLEVQAGLQVKRNTITLRQHCLGLESLDSSSEDLNIRRPSLFYESKQFFGSHVNTE
ncbi:hypothetical protein QCA50_014531 [Cerrena zonata]|uniref:Uncharacterized protein n=1 Tax=Cerrena zonata TaxID=2478898 RepID=A0AAW0FQF6_9APHY